MKKHSYMEIYEYLLFSRQHLPPRHLMQLQLKLHCFSLCMQWVTLSRKGLVEVPEESIKTNNPYKPARVFRPLANQRQTPAFCLLCFLHPFPLSCIVCLEAAEFKHNNVEATLSSKKRDRPTAIQMGPEGLRVGRQCKKFDLRVFCCLCWWRCEGVSLC